VGRIGLAGLVWVGTFALVYLGVARAEAGSSYMQSFWDAKMLDFGSYLRPVHAWDILARMPVQPFVPDRPLDWFPPVTWLATAWGLWALRGDRARLACIAGPLVALLAASAIHRYPIAPRVCVFAAPVFFLVYAKTLDDLLARWPGPRVRLVAGSVVALWVVTLGVLSLNTRFWAPPTRQLVAAFRARAQSREPVYLFAGIVPFWLVYATDWNHPDTAFVNAVVATQSATGNAFHNAASRGRAVADTEGAGLTFTTGGRLALVGLAPGIQWREGHGFNQPFPDAGWGQREATRMRAVASPVIWVAVSHLYPGERGALTRALELAGARRDSVWEKRGTALERYRFGGP
jgi:hypothetical protein